ncbi:hypothetical protein Tco_1159246 [Tanacetum coccineum]
MTWIKCNSKADLNVLPYLKACMIIGKIMKRHPLKDALTLYAPSPFIYMQQLWYTIIRAPNEKDVMRFKIDQQEVDFTLVNFRTALRLPIPTSDKPFDQPSEFLTIAKFINKISYVGELENLTQFEVKKLPQPWQTLFIVLNRCATTKLNAYDQSKLNIMQITYPAVPKLFVELYHYVYNDDLVAKMFATSAKVQEVIGHPVELQTEDIMRTEAYQVCVEEYGRSPKPKSMFQKLKEKIVGELSEPQKPIQIKVKHPQPDPLSFVIHVTTSTEYELHLSNKENPKKVVDEDDEMTDDDDHIDHTLIRNKKTGSMETRNGKVQTPIPTPPRFFRNDLSSNKATFMELMDNLDTISEVLRTSDLPGILKKVDDALHVVVPKISIDATNKSTFGSSSANVTTSSKPTSSSKSQVVHKPRTYAPQPPILDYDDTWIDNYDINDGVFISENADIEFMAKIQGIKWVPTTVDYDKMKFAHNNILKSQCRTGAGYEYHLQQIKSFMNNQVVWESRQPDIPQQFPKRLAQVFKGCARDPNAPERYLFNKDLFFLRNGNTEAKNYIISLYKFHATLFPEDDLNKLLKRWIDEVIVKRSNDMLYSIVESNFKYMNKNYIEDMYYICLKRRIDTPEYKQQTALIQALLIYIRSCVIREKVHDF